MAESNAHFELARFPVSQQILTRSLFPICLTRLKNLNLVLLCLTLIIVIIEQKTRLSKVKIFLTVLSYAAVFTIYL